jgi:hypothetical protein
VSERERVCVSQCVCNEKVMSGGVSGPVVVARRKYIVILWNSPY